MSVHLMKRVNGGKSPTEQYHLLLCITLTLTFHGSQIYTFLNAQMHIHLRSPERTLELPVKAIIFNPHWYG